MLVSDSTCDNCGSDGHRQGRWHFISESNHESFVPARVHATQFWRAKFFLFRRPYSELTFSLVRPVLPARRFLSFPTRTMVVAVAVATQGSLEGNNSEC